ncbi:MAG: LysR family transcriptional regulator [Paracoccaceae bacterium]|nr:LysR family transcriptional regulator [Paracoccaceae bacterium]
MNLSGFDLNLLKVLDALLREGSTTRAAERVGLTQPAVSAALRRLRLSLGDDLFLRRGQGLVPTDFARSLELPLREALDGLGALLGGPAAFDPARSTDVFKLSGIDFFAEMLMPGLARELAARAPGMRVQLVDLVPDAYVEMLEKHQVDIGLLPAVDFPGWIDSRPLFHSAFVTVARQGHPRLARAGLTPGDTIPIDLFCDLGHVLCSPDGRLTAMGDAALATLGRERRVAMTLPFFSGVTRVVAETDLVALVPRQLALRVAPRLGLVLYRQPMPVRAPLIAMIWHRRARANPAHAWLRDLVARLLTPLNDGEAPQPA